VCCHTMRALCLDALESTAGMVTMSDDVTACCNSEQTLLPTASPDGCSADALKQAIVIGDAPQVQKLLVAKADVHHRYSSGLTALHFAVLHNHLDIATLLYREGADPHAATSDGAAVTPTSIAHMEGLKEFEDLFGEEPPERYPRLQRFAGPFALTMVIVANYVTATFLIDPNTRWDGWCEADSAAQEEIEMMRFFGITFSVIFLVNLAMVNTMDPGYVDHSEVDYIHELRELPEEMLVVLDEDRFAVLDRSGENHKPFRWCTTCNLWRPLHVSHCSACKHCLWRFDHHCIWVGNCIAARNHRFFAAMLLSGTSAWIFGMVGVYKALRAHSAEGQTFTAALLVPSTWGHWPLFVAGVFFFFGCLGTSVLIIFGGFHTLTLFFNFNTKICYTGAKGKYHCNSPSTFRQLFFLPLKFRGLDQEEKMKAREWL